MNLTLCTEILKYALKRLP
jgi:NIMA (never in mitosis gene a)-related kinase